MHSIYRNLRRTSLVSILSLSLLVACQPSQVNQTKTPNSPPASGSTSSSTPVLQKPPVKGKTFFGIYMVGSDLEDDIKPRNGISDEEDTGAISTRGSGSNDLRELIEGWKQLTPAHQATLDILVAFGGARKQGWKGVKYATMPCILEDSQDNYFGNATCYQ